MNIRKPFSFDMQSLNKIKMGYEARNAKVATDIALLLKDADQTLSKGPFSVTFKKAVAPSGDPHDYVSLSRYKWPNPNTPDGLPYVARDGESNPELEKYDRNPLGELCESVSILALAYYFSSEAKYAAHTVKLLRTWFLDTETRMNPHFLYGGYVPGRNYKGGIIAGILFLRIVNFVFFLNNYKQWTSENKSGLEQWFRELRDWLLSSELGMKELAYKQNHGIWTDAQVIGFSIFIGDEDIARNHLKKYTFTRFLDHFDVDGSQPNELKRTNAKTYCEYNLNGWIEVATFADTLGLDLWRYETEDGRSIKKAIDWFVPYILNEKRWIHQQISEYQPGKMIPHLMRAAVAFQDDYYKEVAHKLKGSEKISTRTRILYLED